MQGRSTATGGQETKARPAAQAPAQWRPTPLSQALAALLIAGSATGAAQAQARPFSSGWFADKGAAPAGAQRPGRMPDGSLAGVPSSARQQAASRQQLQRSLDSLNRTAAAVAAQQAAQATARASAAAGGAVVPDGLAQGGLQAAQGAQARWEGAKPASESVSGGHHTINIEQTQARAILNWETFNVGRNTTVQFRQGAGDAVLNRVVGAEGRPSEIHGAIKADGTVLVVNQNGVVFTGTSQVNVRNLVAAAATITDAQFRDKGLYTDADGTQPSFRYALGKVQVQAGARIETATPDTATRGGGYVLLLGREVENAGALHTPKGQAALAAGDDFYIRKGYGTEGNATSTTAGHEVSATLKPGNGAGRVRNTGLISAPTGDITLTGHDVRQDGVIVASTDIGARGAIHLLNRASDTAGSVTLGAGSVTAVVLEQSVLTGLDGQRDAALQEVDGRAVNKASGVYDNLSVVADRRDQSRIELVSGGTAVFEGGSTALATGGQIAVSARSSALRDGARLDVAGAIGVRVSMESNNLSINVQGNEQRDAPMNRDARRLNNSDVWVDRRTLVSVAAGVNGYQNERWYTAGGLLEVGGYLATGGHSAGEWLAQGGTAIFTGGEVSTHAGSDINLSGGTLDVQDGVIRQSWLRGTDGRLYELSRAPGDLLYTGLYRGYEQISPRWGEKATRRFYNPLIAPQERYESGYTTGRDAGRLVIATERATLAGGLTGEVYQGDRQSEAPRAALEGYYQSQTAVARRGQLVVGGYLPRYDEAGGTLAWGLSGVADKVVVGEGPAGEGEIRLDADWLNAAGLGGLKLAAREGIEVDRELRLAAGGEAALYAPGVDIAAEILAPGGSIAAGNVLNQMNADVGRIEDVAAPATPGVPAGVRLAANARLDVGGLWASLMQDPEAYPALAYRNGGTVSLRSSGGVQLDAGSVIDATGGGGVQRQGKILGGKGGNVTLAANALGDGETGVLRSAAAILGQGMQGGGTLVLQADRLRIGGAEAAEEGVSGLLPGDFQRGFSQYHLIGAHGIEVAPGADIRVEMPVHRASADARRALGKADALETWTPPLYQEDPVLGVLSQRKGAGLLLQAGTRMATVEDRDTVAVEVGRDARIAVDAGQRIGLRILGNARVDGTLLAPGGEIRIDEIPYNTVENAIDGGGGKRLVWLGEHAVLDVAGLATVARDAAGRRYGRVLAGGSIVIGGDVDDAAAKAEATNGFIVVRPGARFDASGASAELDWPQGGSRLVASDGGLIAVSSNSGLYLDGDLAARAGGEGAAGGRLAIALETPLYTRLSPVSNTVRRQRELIVRQQGGPALAADWTPDTGLAQLRFGEGEIVIGRHLAGGFGSLSLLSSGTLSFAGDVNLTASQAVRLYGGGFAWADDVQTGTVSIAAPYVLLAESLRRGADGYTTPAWHGGFSERPAEGRFVVDAGVLDVRDRVNFGLNGTIDLQDQPGGLRVERRGFDRVELGSQTDLRLLRGIIQDSLTELTASGDIVLAAAQIYPATRARVTVKAGTSEAPRDVILLSRGAPAALPYSAFGELVVIGDRIEQRGTLRAPLGNIELKGNEVLVAAGSALSVSGLGLTMPYGGTVDDVVYQYGGETVAPESAGTHGLINLEGELTIEPGSSFDLSGGGRLLGAGFISGRGGSTDARYYPLTQTDARGGGFILPGLDTNPIYAIVPGAQPLAAPVKSERGERDPAVGQRITLETGVPGLPAGTYTLMPASYALMPGAFRVELNGLATGAPVAGVYRMRNGSWTAPATLSVAGTGIRQAEPGRVVLTPADTLRSYSQYKETRYADYVLADAARRGVPRAMLERDAKILALENQAGLLSFGADVDFRPEEGGRGGEINVKGKNVEIVGAQGEPTPGFSAYLDADLNRLGASRISVGGVARNFYTQTLMRFTSETRSAVIRSGAALRAPEVFVSGGDILVEHGASINTVGAGRAYYDGSEGYIYAPGRTAVLAVSNGYLQLLPQDKPEDFETMAPGDIVIGGCAGVCAGAAGIHTEGTLAAATDAVFQLDGAARYGARRLVLAVSGVNAGSPEALAQARASSVLPAGMQLDQGVLDSLMRGDTDFGSPALEDLVLTVRDSFNFYGSAALSTLDAATGVSRLRRLVLNAPAIYGYGSGTDRASIQAGTLVWGGAPGEPPAPVADGAGTGSGTLDIRAERIELGYATDARPDGVTEVGRIALGFGTVNLEASDRISSNNRGALSVYQSRGAYAPESGYAYHGGILNLLTPLLTGEAGSVSRITAGGVLSLTAPEGVPPPEAGAGQLGAELRLQGGALRMDGTVALPSGKLGLSADGDVVLSERARIDMSGRAVTLHDATRYSWGGDVDIASAVGNIMQAAGSVVDLSAVGNQAGRLKAVALDAAAGLIDLQGRILGTSSGRYDAGGTWVPYDAGAVEVHAQSLGDFAALNQRLNDGGVFGGRAFQIKQGDLTIGDELRARRIDVSVDGGRLTVQGRIDASGESVGSIRLAARDGLRLAGSAVLDAHGSRLRVDSYGKVIDAPNRALVELAATQGTLQLDAGARIDVRAGVGSPQGEGRAIGTVELNAPRLAGAVNGDIDIQAGGPLEILGARSIGVNAMQQYRDAPAGAGPSANGRDYQVITQAYLDELHGQSQAFMARAMANPDLLRRLAGLRAYEDAFHLRPGVEIASATPDGDLIVQGDLDLSAYRYASLNPRTPLTGVYGSGEPGRLVLRAGGDLAVYGSITDGFAPPSAGVDENGWLLTSGSPPYGSDMVVPTDGVKLAAGSTFPGGAVLNFEVSLQQTQMRAGTVLPAEGVLAEPMTVPAGTVLVAAVRDAQGNMLYAAGTLLGEAVTLPADTRLDAGSLLPAAAMLAPMRWPAGVALPSAPTQGAAGSDVAIAEEVTLRLGARLPSGANVKLPDDASQVELRPADGNGSQGRNWAVAQMLPAGSQSWSLRLVAGADLDAADSRLTRPDPRAGGLVLADTHYQARIQGGGTVWVITPLGEANGMGPAGSEASPEAVVLCELLPGYCEEQPAGKIVKVWNEAGASMGFPLGEEVSEENLWWCDIGLCDDKMVEGKKVAEILGQNFSVLRTGAADLDLAAAGSVAMMSPFGVYTAGTPSADAGPAYQGGRGSLYENGAVLGADGGDYEKLVNGGADSLYRAWYPEHGGNLWLRAGGDLTGSTLAPTWEGVAKRQVLASGDVNNWLWRQGSGSALAGDDAIPTAWWINFGTYVREPYIEFDYAKDGSVPKLAGFTGLGTLGGGNVSVDVAGDAGTLVPHGTDAKTAQHSQAIVVAVGGTGRVLADGEIALTGGGDLLLRVGGYNPGLQARAYRATGQNFHDASRHALNGVLANLRGAIRVEAGALGGVQKRYGVNPIEQDPREGRPYDVFQSTRASATGGLVLVPGDSGVSLNTRGDLVLGGVADPGRTTLLDTSRYTDSVSDAERPGGGMSWFSLWTGGTALDLFSAGGNLTPLTLMGEVQSQDVVAGLQGNPTDYRYVYPSVLRATAAAGSIYYGDSALAGLQIGPAGNYRYSLVLAPSAVGRLELLAGGSIYGGGYPISMSGASGTVVPTPLNPGFAGQWADTKTITNTSADGLPYTPANFPLFAFGRDSASGSPPRSSAKFYAGSDLVGVQTGLVYDFSPASQFADQRWYVGGSPARMLAGRDIVGSGMPVGVASELPHPLSGSSAGNLFVHADATDVSIVSAGRDIMYGAFNVAGPGVLEISAGRNILLEDKGAAVSLGAVAPGDSRPGATIAMQAGVGAQGPDYAGFLARYLGGKIADPARPLTDQGLPFKTYEPELLLWLTQRYGFVGSAEDARAYFDALPAEQQRIFARQVYFFELRDSGREYNGKLQARQGSYLRGRQAIAALFPDRDAQGQALRYEGDITMYGGAGLQTRAGGSIQVLSPGGAQVYGVEGAAPPSTAGVVTQGNGDIQLYAQDSILLGQSRIMTTFGGGVLAWSAQGDINAGRGSKTTVVYTPPRRVYDALGNTTLSPNAPATGAGIATLAPLAEVPAGDVDLYAPLGTIDAGEAGIRVSGNVNIAALQVVNAANIQAQGESSGIPAAASVNTGALTSASAAASSAVNAAQESVQRAQSQARQNQPSIISVQILGYGEEPVDGAAPSAGPRAAAPDGSRYDSASAVQVLGAGTLNETEMRGLSAEERRKLSM